jgi:hypothetical protein
MPPLLMTPQEDPERHQSKLVRIQYEGLWVEMLARLERYVITSLSSKERPSAISSASKTISP